MDACGTVFVTKDVKKFTLKCTLCKKDIRQWDDFVYHIQSFHDPANEIDPLMDQSPPLDLDILKVDEVDAVLEILTDKIKEEEFVNMDGHLTQATNAEHLHPGKNEGNGDGFSVKSLRDEDVVDDDPTFSPANSDTSSDSSTDSEEGSSKSNQTFSKFIPSFCKRNKATNEFIELYRNQPCLWDPNHGNYKNFPVRAAVHKKIIDTMKTKCHVTLTERLLRAAIKKLRRHYYTTLKALKGPNTKIPVVVHEYFDQCSFLSVFNEHPEDLKKENDSMKYLVFGKFNEITLAFIEAYCEFPALYDPNHSDYSNYSVRKGSYENMIKMMKEKHNIVFSENEIYKGIYNLRQWYYKTQDQCKNSDGTLAALPDAQQIYVDKCSFLPPKQVKKKLSCEICAKISQNELTLQSHMFREHQIGQWPYKCPECEQSFEYKATLQAHQKRKHVGKVHQCEYCERRFAVITDLQRHIRTHTGEKPFVCELCGKAFRSKAQLGYHSDAIHTKTRAFKCTMCPKDFLKRRDLKDHIKAHLNIRDKICETCGKGFTNCHSLIRHRQIHSEVKKFACKLCEAKFHQFVGLNAHMKRTHNIVKNKPNN